MNVKLIITVQRTIYKRACEFGLTGPFYFIVESSPKNQYNLIYQKIRKFPEAALMAKQKPASTIKTQGNGTGALCKVESIISVDERGQMVLPKELREKAGIMAGDKLAVTSWEKNGNVCCITLIKVDQLVELVKGQLGPILKEIL
jgi:antitoxin PrlF